MIMIPAAALMSTHRLHLSVVRLDCGCKINAFFVFGNKSATNLITNSILHLILLRFPGTESFKSLVAEQRDERYGAIFDMLL